MTPQARVTYAAAAAVVVLATAACGSDNTGDGSAEPEPSATSSVVESASGSASASASATTTTTLSDDKPFGPGCGRFRSASGLSVGDVDDKPTTLFATGAPPLRDAFGKMLQVGLGEEQDVTFFIPTNQAVNALPLDVRGQLVGDLDKARQFFGHHVVDGRLAPSRLAGEHTTLADDTLPITVDGDDVGVGLQGASVICGNIETLDATIYVVDQALQS
jgi:Fasciclin domain